MSVSQSITLMQTKQYAALERMSENAKELGLDDWDGKVNSIACIVFYIFQLFQMLSHWDMMFNIRIYDLAIVMIWGLIWIGQYRFSVT